MTDHGHALSALNRDFVRHHPADAARAAAALKMDDLAAWLGELPPEQALAVWDGLPMDAAERVLERMEGPLQQRLVARADPVRCARVLARLDPGLHDRLLAGASPARARELGELMRYREDSAGALMDPRFLGLRLDMTVRAALQRLRRVRPRSARQLFLLDDADRPARMVELQDLALAEPTALVAELGQPLPAVVSPTASREEVVDLFDRHRLSDLPVVDLDGRLVGVIRHDALVEAMRTEASADLQAMVGASRDERALSGVGFVVRKRLPWLQINLLTAFLAAAVVGLFESVIAQFTALAVLLPVVAGQSGNTGAQALAVTMRGLALHEIGTSQWLRVARKELGAGFVNGVAVAAVTAAGVWVWSGSTGLAVVIATSMVIAMVAAAFAGVVIPVALSSLGQDPAQSSSIILTTVTDVTGFFAFLGIATLMMGML